MYENNDNLTESVNALVSSRLEQLNTAIPAKIQSFNPVTQTVECQCAINRVNKSTGESVAYPLLVDLPIQYPIAGGFALTLPIKSGDDCLVVFAQRSIDGWFADGKVKPESENRLHDLSDGIALIGISSQADILPNYNTNAMELRNKQGTAKITISDNSIVFTVGGINMTIDASGITTSSDVVINGKSFTTHTHSGVQSGGSNTGVPV